MGTNGSGPDNKRLAHKAIVIKLNKFSFLHGEAGTDDNDLFVGRKYLIEKIVNILKKTSKNRGSYLISGYRGVGKTSVINRAIEEYYPTRGIFKRIYTILEITTQALFKGKPRLAWHHINEKFMVIRERVVVIRVNLGDSSKMTPMNIYYSIANILKDELNNYFLSSLFPSYFLNKVILSVLSLAPILLSILFIHHAIGVQSEDIINLMNLNLSEHAPIIFFLMIIVYFVNRAREKTFRELDDLILRMENEVTELESSELKNGALRVGRRRNKKSLPIQTREAEHKLTKIINDLKTRIIGKKINIIFVFDEIDKLSEREMSATKYNNKADQINNLLGSIKNFITTPKAQFFFITGREIIDSYYSERDSANSLYESLFDQVFEVPSFLTDEHRSIENKTPTISGNIEAYVCHRLGNRKGKKPYNTLNEFYQDLIQGEDKDEVRLAILVLRNFIYYLTFHSWGNPKRLSSIFEGFMKTPSKISGFDKNKHIIINNNKKGGDYWLQFTFNQQRSLSFCANLFTIFQHQLSREVSIIGDKITVSALSSLQFILKFHQHAFTRESLHRMSEAINIHRSPELNVIVDDLLSQVFKPYIRRVRNGAYRYRFQNSFEQEIRYISNISEIDSSSFNFSLNAMSRVKKHFEDDLENDKTCNLVRSKSSITLGDMSAIEQSFNLSAKHYTTAINLLSKEGKDFNSVLFSGFDIQTTYLEAIVKFGDLEEHRQNYSKSAILYAQANKFIERVILSSDSNTDDHKILRSGDSKWDIYKQAYWASIFLSLKRSPPSKIDDIENKQLRGRIFDISNDPRYHLRFANYVFFSGSADIESAANSYHTAYLFSRKKWGKIKSQGSSEESEENERRDYLCCTALSGLAESAFIFNSFKLICGLEKNENGENFFINEVTKIIKSPVIRINCTKMEVGTPLYIKDTPLYEKCGSIDGFKTLEKSAKGFEKSSSFISAAIVYFKLISLRLMMLDILISPKNEDGFGQSDAAPHFEKIKKYSESAIACINLARQLDSSQSIKTLVIRDYQSDDDNGIEDTDKYLSQLFDFLIHQSTDVPKSIISFSAFWQHSFWGQKLAALLYWAEFIKSRITGHSHNSKILPPPNDNEHFEPSKIPTLSIRSSIMMRWVYARSLVEKRLYACIDNKCKFRGSDLLQELQKDNSSKKCISLSFLWKSAYLASRNLYFVLLDIRLISRKNLDLVYPFLVHMYYEQWKLLERITSCIIEDKIFCEKNNLDSFHSITSFIQRQFLMLDKCCGGRDKIAPSHFDYDFIYLKLIVNLKDAMHINDETSHTRTSILQQKYFFHDDHSDQEFRMDWTLSNVFSPAAVCMLSKAENAHQKLIDHCNDKSSNSGKGTLDTTCWYYTQTMPAHL